jgi:hypothetical protein
MTRFGVGSLALIVIALLLSQPRCAQAAQSYDNCTGFITSIPATISTQGTWCMKQDLTTAMTSGNAITIAANNVTIDCNDFKLGGLAAGVGTAAIGIYAIDRQNSTVRRCNIRGFEAGIFLESTFAGGNLVEDNRFDGNTYVAIRVDGDGSAVQRNRVFDTGGSTLGASAYGITSHYNVDIIDNTVSGVKPRTGGNGSGLGIQTYLNSSNTVRGNRVSRVLGDGGGTGLGIYNFSSSRVVLRDNDLIGDALASSIGLHCNDANGSAKNNVISGFATGLETCSDDGGNSVHP